MLRAIIVDHEQPAGEWLNRLLTENGSIQVVGCFTKAQEALDKMSQLRPDAAFVDIRMPLMSGVELIRRIRERDPAIEIICVSGYVEYALRAFELQVLDFVAKPPTAERLQITVKRLLKHHRKERGEREIGLMD
ncbi:Response regulator receiver domain-containing protein [Paenibacillus sp. UNCCL117]|uniref:LytR/AlgR family response regulator transcription factor n=1 Tax=unclassified Paenibacillus TaxID=185978 RepID=UPI00088A52D0|nr:MULTISPECIES: response regulator [unclassified Paenibacillus]SDE46810.1 Response regulator receiver domain-containing protein [Paenibacillus sp. cl123]SFW65790.1 Response regulator receiver domain-containing protein [Paenibacillus sp. UNCCL117]